MNGAIDNNIFIKIERTRLFITLYIKHAVCNLLILKTVNTPNLIKIGGACEIHGEFVIIRNDIFCTTSSLCNITMYQ